MSSHREATGALEISGASRCDDMSYLTGWSTWLMGRAERSPGCPGQPGGEVRVAEPGVRGSSEDVQLAGPDVAQVHHDRLGDLAAVASVPGIVRRGCRRPAGIGERGPRAGHRCRGKADGTGPRGAQQHTAARRRRRRIGNERAIEVNVPTTWTRHGCPFRRRGTVPLAPAETPVDNCL